MINVLFSLMVALLKFMRLHAQHFMVMRFWLADSYEVSRFRSLIYLGVITLLTLAHLSLVSSGVW